jgi:hypothetical protein
MGTQSSSLSDEITLQDLLEVQKHLGLPSAALVEKDFRVVQALTAIIAIDTAPVRLVFGGGTSLSRAHRIIRWMSSGKKNRLLPLPECSGKSREKQSRTLSESVIAP